MVEILHQNIPYDPLMARALPGVQPLNPKDWLIVDEVYAAQMAERDRLLSERREAVLQMDADALPAAQELLRAVLDDLAGTDKGFVIADTQATRPDGVKVTIDMDDPLATLGHLVQCDLCLMEKRGNEHVLTGAILCFPASWTLAEKFLRPMVAIHAPVASYDASIAKRVQRLFDGVQVGRPLWRFNTLWYQDADLHQPRRASGRRPGAGQADGPYLRSERQSILRLPETGAVVFGIHNYVLSRQRVRELGLGEV